MLNHFPGHVTLSQNHMATTFSLCISTDRSLYRRAESCLLEAHETLSTLEKELSEFLPNSPISQLNSKACGTAIPLSIHTSELFKTAFYLEEISEGAFSITAKGGSDSKAGLRLFHSKSIERTDPLTHVSFGAIGKGFALDRIRQLVENWGFENYLFSAGGSSLVVSGFSNPFTPQPIPWTIGWSTDGVNPNYILNHSSGKALSLGISGTSEKGNHILDPRSKKPSTGVLSALVAHPSASHADALSTGLFVLGWEKGLQAYSQLFEKPSLALIDEKGNSFWNGTFENTWGPLQ